MRWLESLTRSRIKVIWVYPVVTHVHFNTDLLITESRDFQNLGPVYIKVFLANLISYYLAIQSFLACLLMIECPGMDEYEYDDYDDD